MPTRKAKSGVWAAVAWAAALPLLSCHKAEEPKPIVVARVGERILTEDEVAAWEASLRQQIVAGEVRGSFIKHWVEDELLVQAARDRGLVDDPWVQGRLDEVSRRLLTSRLLDLETADATPPAPATIQQYYQSHREEFTWQKLHLAIQFWRCSSRASLDRLRGELLHARPTPLQPGESAAIDTGSFEVDDPAGVDPIAWRLFGWMPGGQLGYPVRFHEGFWMFRVTQRNEAGTPQSLEDVRDLITSRLLEDERMQVQGDIVRKLTVEYRRAGKLDWPSSIGTSVTGDSARPTAIKGSQE